MKTIVLLLIIVNFSSRAFAFPDYTKKEGKDCIYCHQSSRGGPTNARGRFYGEHKTFEGYIEKLKSKKAHKKAEDKSSASGEPAASP